MSQQYPSETHAVLECVLKPVIQFSTPPYVST